MKITNLYLVLYVSLLILLLGENSMADIFFSTQKYQKEIIIETSLLNKLDVAHLFSSLETKGMSHSGTFNNDLHLVVRIMNTGGKGAWGILMCNVKGYGDVQVYVPHLKPNMKEFVDFVIPLSGMITPRSMGLPPTIEIKWEKLNSK